MIKAQDNVQGIFQEIEQKPQNFCKYLSLRNSKNTFQHQD